MLFVLPAFIAAIFYFFPNFFPFLTPCKGLATSHAIFLWEIRLVSFMHELKNEMDSIKFNKVTAVQECPSANAQDKLATGVEQCYCCW